MGNQPESMVDPNGLFFRPEAQISMAVDFGESTVGMTRNVDDREWLNNGDNIATVLIGSIIGGGGNWVNQGATSFTKLMVNTAILNFLLTYSHRLVLWVEVVKQQCPM